MKLWITFFIFGEYYHKTTLIMNKMWTIKSYPHKYTKLCTKLVSNSVKLKGSKAILIKIALKTVAFS